jgi:DeoR family transcriptional regulator of aga operon
MRALLRAGDISVQELVEQIGTSAPSIRRDLARLEKRGLVLRTHGGATLVEQLLKRRIGLAASELIAEKETIGLTAGTTSTQIGRSLRHRRGISVITNALNIGMELCNQPAIKTTLTGGSLAWAWTFALAGQPALNTLREVYLDKAFISVTGFDLERGVTTLETEEATVSLAMLRQAREVIVVADSSKIGHVSPALICPISAIHVLVTDSAVPADVVKALKAKGIKVVIA